MPIEKFTFYTSSIKEAAEISNHLKKLPKKTLKSLESLESTEEIGIDSPVALKYLIRIFPITGEITKLESPKESSYCNNETRFKNKGMKYHVLHQPPIWLK